MYCIPFLPRKEEEGTRRQAEDKTPAHGGRGPASPAGGTLQSGDARSVRLSSSLEFNCLSQTLQPPFLKVILPGTQQATVTCGCKSVLKSDHFLQYSSLVFSSLNPVSQAPGCPLTLDPASVLRSELVVFPPLSLLDELFSSSSRPAITMGPSRPANHTASQVLTASG